VGWIAGTAFGIAGVVVLAIVMAALIIPSPQSTDAGEVTDTMTAVDRVDIDSVIQANPLDSLARLDPTRVAAAYELIRSEYDTTAAVQAWRAAALPIATAQAKRDAEAEEARRLAEKWSYTSDTDPMTGKDSHVARIASENTVNFGFPYAGPQHAVLILREHPSYGHDVILQIEQGQFLCPSYEGCQVRVRFDDGASERWDAGGPSDNSTTVLFIQNYTRFLQRMRKADVVRIQPEIYQEGAPVFEFRTGGYDPSRHKPGA
jgi:hypothetical protein